MPLLENEIIFDYRPNGYMPLIVLYTELDSDKKVKLGVINIINIGLKKKVDLEEFECELTVTEKKAFSVLKESLNENKETCLSISKVCESTGISRPIWKNLFAKMEKQQIAEISNMGVKGTFIKFL